jgi:DHA1 family multidrug resistance protein-like MFS transporter
MITYMPVYLDALSVGRPIIQLIMTIFPLTLFIFPPILGKFSDKIQNRFLFIIFGAIGIILSLLMLIFTQNLVLIILFSLSYGFFIASYRVIFTLYNELVRNNKRYISIYNALSTAGWFAGSQFGGIFVEYYGIMNIFLFLLIISLINLFIVAFIKEYRTLILDHYENQTSQNPDNFNEEKSVSISIYYGLFFRNFGLKPIMTVLSLIMGFHLSTSIEIGFLIGLNFLIQVLLMLLIGHIIKEKNDKLILILGYFFSSIAILGYIFATDFFGFLIAQIFVAFSYSMFWSASVIHIAQNTTPLNKGKFMGLANTSTFSGGFLGGLFFSILLIVFNSNYYFVMVFMVIFPLLSVVSILIKYKPKKKRFVT